MSDTLYEALADGRMRGQVENIERMMRENNDWRRAAEEAQEANRQLLAKFNELVRDYNECVAEKDVYFETLKEYKNTKRISAQEVQDINFKV